MDPWSTNDSGFDSPHNHSSIHSEDNIGNNNSNNGDGLRLPPPIDISVNFEIPDLMGVSGTDARAILSPPVLPNFMMESQKNSSSSFINNSTASGASTAVNNKFHNHETRLQQLLQSSSEWEPAILAGNYNSSSSSSDTTTTAACVDILARLRDYFAELANGLLVHAGGSSSGKFMDLVSHLMKATPVIISSSLAPAESTSLITGMMHSVSLQQSFTTSASTNDLNDSAMFMKLDIKRKSFSRLIHLQTLNWACLSKTDLVAIKDSIDQMLNYYNSTSAAAATATATSLSSLKHFSAMENSNPFSSPIPYFSSATTTSTSSLPVISEFEEDESTSIWNTAILNNTGRKLSRVSLSESSDSLSLILKSIQTDINLKKTVLDVESLVKLCQFSSSIQSTSSSSSSSFWGIEELVSLIEVAFYQPVMDLFAAALKDLPELLVLEKEYKTSSAALALQRRRLQQQEKTFGKSDSGFLDRSLSSSREQDSSTPLFAATFSSPSTHSSSTTAAAAAATRAEWIKVKTPAQIPANVDPAGYDVLGQPLFIARAEYQNGLVLGKVGRHTNGILIACSKSLQEKCLVGFEFEVLKSLEGMSWVSIEAYQRRSRNLMDDDGSDGLWTLPDGAVYGGYDTSGTLFYVCRAVSFQSKRGSSPPPPPPTLSKKKSSFRLSLMYGLNSVMGVGSSATSTTATHTRSRSNSDEKVTTLVPGRCSESRLGATITAGSKMEEGVFPFEVLILNY